MCITPFADKKDYDGAVRPLGGKIVCPAYIIRMKVVTPEDIISKGRPDKTALQN